MSAVHVYSQVHLHVHVARVCYLAVVLNLAVSGKGLESLKTMIFGIVTRIDLLNFITSSEQVPTSPRTQNDVGAGDSTDAP